MVRAVVRRVNTEPLDPHQSFQKGQTVTNSEPPVPTGQRRSDVRTVCGGDGLGLLGILLPAAPVDVRDGRHRQALRQVGGHGSTLAQKVVACRVICREPPLLGGLAGPFSAAFAGIPPTAV